MLGECTVITDPEPDGPRSPIRTYLAALRAMPERATHLLVIQDDVRPCILFRERAAAAIAEHTGSLVTLFLAGAPHRSAQAARRAHRLGDPWIRMDARDWTPTVALAWPRALRDKFLRFLLDRPQLVRVGDDNVVGEFVRAHGLEVWAAVPSLVEHPDVEPSLIGRKAGHGANRMRVAAVPPVS